MESHEKMLDLVMNTMNNVTEKLTAMDDRITGLASRIDTPAKTVSKKSCSREQSKRRGVTDTEEALFASPTGVSVIQEGGTSYSQVFPDTAVALKPVTTPARPKKQKHTLDLGLTPLNYQPTVSTQVTSTISAPTQGSFEMGACTQTKVTTSEMVSQGTVLQQSATTNLPTEEITVQDHNQNVVFGHMDQFGNLVRVQGPAESMESRDVFVPATERNTVMNPVNQPTLDSLHSNPLIQQLVEERMAALEARMKFEIQGGMQKRRKSGRYNVADTPHVTPHLRWPNESCVIGTARKRVTFDELSLGPFVIGFVNNVIDTQHVPTMKNMLTELVEAVKLAENISWPIARGVLAASMLKIEDESIFLE